MPGWGTKSPCRKGVALAYYLSVIKQGASQGIVRDAKHTALDLPAGSTGVTPWRYSLALLR